MNYQTIYYPESKTGGFTNVDGTLAFYNRVNALISSNSVVVDIGCGRGAYGEDPIAYRRQVRILKGKCACVIGLDVDPRAGENPYIDEFRLIKGLDVRLNEPHIEQRAWPVVDEGADVCISDNVLEHVPDPDLFFAECNRMLKPGGYVCIRTPNVLSYFGLISRFVPNRQHVSWLRKAKDQVKEQDIFPTLYRCNTIGCIRRLLQKHGFEANVYGYEAEPSYLSFSRIFYFLGVLHQRFAPNAIKVGIHAFGSKIS